MPIKGVGAALKIPLLFQEGLGVLTVALTAKLPDYLRITRIKTKALIF